MVRIFRVDVYTGLGDNLRLITDASPWSLGGVFCINGWITGYFSVEINDLVLVFKHTKGDAEGQQTGEALEMLAGLRLFSES